MPVPPLLNRRVHLAGSIPKEAVDVSASDIQDARMYVAMLVERLIRDGATFVVPVDADPIRADGQPMLFDWLVLQSIRQHAHLRPTEAQHGGQPLVVAVQHHKNELQIPPEQLDLWRYFKDAPNMMRLESAHRWNMNSKRMDIQAKHGDILITLGGDEGVLYLADLYNEAGRPVIPLNANLTARDRGSLRLWDMAIPADETRRFFRVDAPHQEHDLLQRTTFATQDPVDRRVDALMQLLRALRRPLAFAVRLLNSDHPLYRDVENFFSAVVKPVAEEFGYAFKVIDGTHLETSDLTQEIFQNLHNSGMAIVDMTGERPNCFIELGYALGRGLPVLINARKGTAVPFDVNHISANFWDPEGASIPQQIEQFRSYWKANEERRPIVEIRPLTP